MDTSTGSGEQVGRARLTASLHAAQALGLLRNPGAVQSLLMGIARAIAQTVEGNRGEPSDAWALRSPVYWDHFEMDLKEALLGSCSGLDPELREAIRRVVDLTIGGLRRSYLCP